MFVFFYFGIQKGLSSLEHYGCGFLIFTFSLEIQIAFHPVFFHENKSFFLHHGPAPAKLKIYNTIWWRILVFVAFCLSFFEMVFKFKFVFLQVMLISQAFLLKAGFSRLLLILISYFEPYSVHICNKERFSGCLVYRIVSHLFENFNLISRLYTVMVTEIFYMVGLRKFVSKYRLVSPKNLKY